MEKKSLKERINEIHNEIVESIKNGSYKSYVVVKQENYNIFRIIVEDAEFLIGVSADNGATYYADDIVKGNVDRFYDSTDPVGVILTSKHLAEEKEKRKKALRAELARLENQEGGLEC